MTEFFSIDTNILIYAFDNADPVKQSQADDLLERMIRTRAVLPLQCLNEFYSATTKKKRLLAPDVAQRVVERALHSLTVAHATSDDLIKAMSLHQTHKVQFYDALLWTTSARAGCKIFLTEDGQFDRDFGGITLHNPFAPGFDLDRLLG